MVVAAITRIIMNWDWQGNIYLHRDVVDFRKSINGLVLIVEQSMILDSMNSSLFVFCCKSRNKLKILYWDSNGYCLWYKRLEQSKFHWPKHLDGDVISLTSEQLDWLLRGLNIKYLTPHLRLEKALINA